MAHFTTYFCHHARQVKPSLFTHPFWPFRHTLSLLFIYFLLRFPFSLSTLLHPSDSPSPRLVFSLALFMASRNWFSFYNSFFFLFVRMLITKWQLCFCQGMGARHGILVRDKILGIYVLIWLIHFMIKLDNTFNHRCISNKF